MAKESITGILSRIRWQSPEENNNFIIAELRTGETIKGVMPEDSRVVGLTYVFQGTWKNEKPFKGQKQRSFWFDQYKKSEPHTRQGMVSYLAKFAPGIGPTLSGRLFDAFGGEAAKILRTDPQRAASEVSGLSSDVALRASEELQKNAKYEECRIHLSELFAGRGFSNSLSDLCIRKWGILAPVKIKRDPFCMLVAGMPSVGFSRCDTLYMQLGLKPWKLKRLMLCIWNTIRTDMEGHVWHDGKKLMSSLQQQATVMDGGFDSSAKPESRVTRAIELGVRAGWLQLTRDTSGKVWVADGKIARNEMAIAEHLSRLTAENPLIDETDIEADERFEFMAYLNFAECGDDPPDDPLSDSDEVAKQIDTTPQAKQAAIRRGIKTGICQFCRRVLATKESQRRGYGPVCARNHNLPWGEESDVDSAVSKTYLQTIGSENQ